MAEGPLSASLFLSPFMCFFPLSITWQVRRATNSNPLSSFGVRIKASFAPSRQLGAKRERREMVDSQARTATKVAKIRVERGGI